MLRRIYILELFVSITYVIARLCPETSSFLAPDACFWLTPTRKNASLGQEDCVQDGGTLAEIIDEESFIFTQGQYKGYLQDNGIEAVWVGLKKEATRYLTWTGVVVQPLPWISQGTSFTDGGDCVVITSEWQWNGTNCTKPLHALCSKVLNECPTGSLYNVNISTCYWIVSGRKHQAVIQDKCRENNGSLAVFGNAEEYSFLVDNYITKIKEAITGSLYNHQWIWIGGNDAVQMGTSITIDGQILKYFNWDDGQPEHYKRSTREECILVKLTGHYKWHDANCYASLEGLCYRKIENNFLATCVSRDVYECDIEIIPEQNYVNSSVKSTEENKCINGYSIELGRPLLIRNMTFRLMNDGINSLDTVSVDISMKNGCSGKILNCVIMDAADSAVVCASNNDVIGNFISVMVNGVTGVFVCNMTVQGTPCFFFNNPEFCDDNWKISTVYSTTGNIFSETCEDKMSSYSTSAADAIKPTSNLDSSETSNDLHSVCYCSCQLLNSSAITNDELQSSIDDMTRELKVEKKNTYAAKASLISATYDRPSAKAAGLFSIVLLSFVCGLFILPDFINAIRYFKLWTNVV